MHTAILQKHCEACQLLFTQGGGCLPHLDGRHIVQHAAAVRPDGLLHPALVEPGAAREPRDQECLRGAGKRCAEGFTQMPARQEIDSLHGPGPQDPARVYAAATLTGAQQAHCGRIHVDEFLTLPLNTPPLLDHMWPADCAAAPADDRRRRCCGSGTATAGPAVIAAVPASAAVWSPLQRLLFGRPDGGGTSSSLRRRMRRGRSIAAEGCGGCGGPC